MRRITIGNLVFSVKIEKEKIKQTRIKINGNKVIVKIPEGKSEKNIKKIILRKLRKLGIDKIDKKLLVNFLFFGNPYKVIYSNAFLIDHKIKVLFFNPQHKSRIKKYVLSSLKNYAKNYLRKNYRKFGLKKIPEIDIRNMKSKFGYLKNGKIVLNLNLCFFPKPLVRYVIDHELLHCKVKSHNHIFEHLISSIYPEYREIEKELKKFSIIIEYNKKLRKIFS